MLQSPLFLTCLFAHFSLAIECMDREFLIQFVHIQDLTESSRDDLELLKTSHMSSELMSQLTEYAKTEYAITSFKDKPHVYTGMGPVGGFMDQEHWDASGLEADYCYKRHLNFTTDPDEVARITREFTASGGKDMFENQWDALYRTINDPDIGWRPEVLDEDGRIVVKFAALITDDGAHFDTVPLKWSEDSSGEWLAKIAENSYQTQYGGMVSDWFQGHPERMQQAIEYGETNGNLGGGYEVDSSGHVLPTSKPDYFSVEALRSLMDVRAHYHYHYGQHSKEMTTKLECLEEINPLCAKFNLYIKCCATGGLPVDHLVAETIDLEECAEGGFDTNQGCLDYGGHRVAFNEHVIELVSNDPDSYPVGAEYMANLVTWDSLYLNTFAQTPACTDPTHCLSKVYDSLPYSNYIVPLEYPYDDYSKFSTIPCESFEYPSPYDKRFRDSITDLNVVPVILAASPSDDMFDHQGYYLSEYITPWLHKNDPYLTLCKKDPDCYSLAERLASILVNEEGYSFLSQGLDFFTYDQCYGNCVKEYFSYAMWLEYSKPLQDIDHIFEHLSSTTTVSNIVSKIKDQMDNIKLQYCNSITTTTEEPETSEVTFEFTGYTLPPDDLTQNPNTYPPNYSRKYSL